MRWDASGTTQKMSMAGYFGDIRVRFDELYGTATSFVRLPSEAVCKNRHVAFNLNLAQEKARDQFRRLCYAYEDSYKWPVLPLVWDSGVPEG